MATSLPPLIGGPYRAPRCRAGRPAACTAWTAVVTAKSTTESELLAFVELTLAQAFRAGLTKDALSMAIDAALSGEAPRFLDAMGKK